MRRLDVLSVVFPYGMVRWLGPKRSGPVRGFHLLVNPPDVNRRPSLIVRFTIFMSVHAMYEETCGACKLFRLIRN
jgi:hypothetical protein